MKRLLWFLIVFALGFAVALLFAPQSGKKTRKRLLRQAKKLRLELEAKAEKSIDALNDWKVSVEELAEDAAKQMNGNGKLDVDAVSGGNI
ncbi:MAG TPA: YtxH domain-containing protein [Chitinophagales bacterium]|nr:YtxH domain-containing protein [Chitinophagales bacterium]HRK27617.1 YtxH domain-containing protein [Chitinophagales bacterium]